MANPLQGFVKALSNAKTRVLVVILLVIAILGISIGVIRKTSTVSIGGGKAELAGVPRDIRSVPGGAVQNDQYLQTLLQANQQAAQQALNKGTTEVATLVAGPESNAGANYNAQMLQGGSSNCAACNCCCNKSGATDAGNDAGGAIAALQASGKISPILAGQLQALQTQNLSPQDYAAKIQELVKEGKLSPEAAQQLIAAYQQAHGGSVSPDDVVSQLAAQGNISPETAQALKALNNSNLSPDDYAAKVQELVREGKLSPEAAQQLISAYKAAHGGSSATLNPDDAVNQLAASGNITPDTAAALKQLNHEGLTPEQYAARLNELVKEGKLTPEQAQQLMHSYQQAHGASGSANAGVNRLLASGAIDSTTAQQLKALNQQQLTPAEYAQHLNDLVKAGKLTPEQARALLNAYNQQHAAQQANQTADDVANKLLNSGAIDPATANQIKALNAQNLSPDQYAAKLQQLVAEGKLTPAQAQQLLVAYQKQHPAGNATTGNVGDAIDQLSSAGAITPDVANQLKSLSAAQLTPQQYQQEIEKLVAEGKLSPAQARQLLSAYSAQYTAQQSVAGNDAPSTSTVDTTTSTQQAAVNQQVAQAMQAAIENQAKQLISAWNPPSQSVVGTLVDVSSKDSSSNGQLSSGSAAPASATAAGTQAQISVNQAPSIRAGDIMFAVLNTAVNSDQPGPVMATIVSGKYKGAKLLGGLQVTPDSEAVTLQFTSMTMPDWSSAVAINSYAIDPDTARTALASNVDHHYLTRFGSVFAAAFMQGIGNAVLQSGSTQINNAGTVTNAYKNLNTKDQILVGLGQVGQSVGNYAQQGMNKKPTVTVNSGAGIGILFVKDAVLPSASSNNNSM